MLFEILKSIRLYVYHAYVCMLSEYHLTHKPKRSARGERKLSDRFSVSISKEKDKLWRVWSEHPRNARDKSGAIMRLIEKEVSENRETYGI